MARLVLRGTLKAGHSSIYEQFGMMQLSQLGQWPSETCVEPVHHVIVQFLCAEVGDPVSTQ